VISKEQALELIHEYRRSIEMVQNMAANGKKNPEDSGETFRMYHCELVLGTNCVFSTVDNIKYSTISFNNLNSLYTTNVRFGEEIESWLRNLEKKSILISGVAEKQRYQFFKRMFERIDESAKYISTRDR